MSQKKVFVFQFHITDMCGNKCLHCYVEGAKRINMNLDVILRIIDDIKSCCDHLGMIPMISITGGDPLLHPSIWEALEKANSIGGQLGILGNPELLDENIVKRLIAVGVKKYQVSLDGMRETHDKIRSPGSFDRTTAGIKLMSRVGLNVNVMSTVSNLNYREMVDVMKHSYASGATRWSFARYTPEVGDCGISSQEYHNFLQQVVIEHQSYTKMGKIFPMKEALMVPLVSEPKESCGVIGGCALGSSMLCILPDASVMPCRRLRESVLGVWENQGDLLDYFLFHPKMDEYRDIKKIEGCGSCRFISQCRGCRAAALAATGKITGIDPQCFIQNQTTANERR